MVRIGSVLVLCTGNSARSILGEALFNRLGQGRLTAHSAGSKPKGVPHPGALRLLATKGIDPAAFRSKSWLEFTGPDAPVHFPGAAFIVSIGFALAALLLLRRLPKASRS